jgi:hypothetical protein
VPGLHGRGALPPRRHPQPFPKAELVLNLNGGFKSVLPFAALYRMIQQRPVFYSYERTETLIKLPALPLTFDWDRLGFAADALTALRDKGIMPAHEFEALLPNHGWGDDPLFEVLIARADGFVSTAIAGDLMFERLAFETESSRVLLSPRAWRKAKGGGDAEPAAMEALKDIRDPLLRAKPGHGEAGRGEPTSRSGRRRKAPPHACSTGRSAMPSTVADILRHDEYDKVMKHGSGVWREEFEADVFRPAD